jgi:hypothetical protein
LLTKSLVARLMNQGRSTDDFPWTCIFNATKEIHHAHSG